MSRHNKATHARGGGEPRSSLETSLGGLVAKQPMLAIHLELEVEIGISLLCQIDHVLAFVQGKFELWQATVLSPVVVVQKQLP